MSRSPIVPVVAAAAIALLGANAADAVNRRAFVTSTTYDGNLAAQPVAGATVLDKADSICRARAAAGGLPNSGAYRAWLSTSATDAYCHVQGLTGKKSTGCGGGVQPGAGPWYQANGVTAFTDSLGKLTGPERIILRNLLFNEFQQPVQFGDGSAWTGTVATGEYSGHACSNWTTASTGESATCGQSFETTQAWTQGLFWNCGNANALICVEPGASSAWAPFWSAGAIAFVTADSASGGKLQDWTGAGGAAGIAAGDAICRAQAAAARLPAPESFVAWLSTSTVDAIDRLSTDGPFRRVDGFSVANDREDLVDGSTAVSLHVTAGGTYRASIGNVLTGTGLDGTWSGSDCAGWASDLPTDEATFGYGSFSRIEYWTEAAETACSSQFVDLYCFSNVVTIFWDGFDQSGDTSRWSTVTP